MKIAVIGCGNMASAVVEGINKDFPSIHFYTYTPSQVRAKELANKVNGVFVSTLSEFPSDIDYWLIGCKPQQLKELADSASGLFRNQIVVSLLAATSLEKTEKILKTSKVIRLMPNTPVKLGQGISLLLGSDAITAKQMQDWKSYAGSLGLYIEVKSDNELDELTVFSGSGPAYIYYFARALEKKLIALGQGEQISRKIINQLFLGSSALMAQDHRTLEELVSQVTSKGGVTIEAIKHFQMADMDDTVSIALDKAKKRSDELNQL